MLPMESRVEVEGFGEFARNAAFGSARYTPSHANLDLYYESSVHKDP